MWWPGSAQPSLPDLNLLARTPLLGTKVLRDIVSISPPLIPLGVPLYCLIAVADAELG